MRRRTEFNASRAVDASAVLIFRRCSINKTARSSTEYGFAERGGYVPRADSTVGPMISDPSSSVPTVLPDIDVVILNISPISLAILLVRST